MRKYLVLNCIAACGLAITAGCGVSAPKSEAAGGLARDDPRPTDGTLVIPPDSPKLRQISVETIATATVPFDEVVSPGKIETNPNRVSRVVLPLAGRVSAVLVRLGDAVERGQPLLTLESPDADAAESTYMQSLSALTQANANLNKAQSDQARSKMLYEYGAVSQKDVLTSENGLAQAKAAQEQAQTVVEQSQRRLGILGLRAGAFGQKVTVPAPISGKILEINVAAGEYRNDTNAAVLTIADLSTVWVSSDVPENLIRFVEVGERLDVMLAAYPGEILHARVTSIADTVDPQTRTVKVHGELDNSRGRLRPEMYGTIRHTESTRVVPVVPVGAVIQVGGRACVWVEMAPGRFRSAPVKVGERVDSVLPVLEGVRAGDRVVVDGAMLLQVE